MNTIGEILKIKDETIYETYKRVLCKGCKNKHNDKDLCKVTRTQSNSARCFNYEKCMKHQCNMCKDKENCDSKEEK